MHIILCSDSPAVREAVADRFGRRVDRLTVCDSGMELLAAVRSLAADLVGPGPGDPRLGGPAPGFRRRTAGPRPSDHRGVCRRRRGMRVPVVQKGIPHVVLGAERDGEMQALLAQAVGRRAAALGAGTR